ncbi:MAG: hypothetical protein ACI94Y_002643 [Maribacter sp.]|jgi:hypothetical protein
MKGKSIKKAFVKKVAVKKLNKVSMSKVKGGTGETMFDG